MQKKDELVVKEVEFLGDSLMAAKDKNGNIWAGVSYFCNALGMSKGQKDRQVTNVQKDETLKRGCLKFEAGVFDVSNETVALRSDFIPLWLAKISITDAMKREHPELADKLLEYQLKVKDVLATAFLTKNDNCVILDATVAGNVADLGRVTERIMRGQGSAPYKIAEVFKMECSQFGIILPADFVKVPEYEQIQLNFTKEKE